MSAAQAASLVGLIVGIAGQGAIDACPHGTLAKGRYCQTAWIERTHGKGRAPSHRSKQVARRILGRTVLEMLERCTQDRRAPTNSRQKSMADQPGNHSTEAAATTKQITGSA